MKWKHFPRYWPFVRGIHRWPVNSPHKGQWRGALMFSLICAWANGWVNHRDAGDLRRHRAHYDVTVMKPMGYGSMRMSMTLPAAYGIIRGINPRVDRRPADLRRRRSLGIRCHPERWEMQIGIVTAPAVDHSARLERTWIYKQVCVECDDITIWFLMGVIGYIMLNLHTILESYIVACFPSTT